MRIAEVVADLMNDAGDVRAGIAAHIVRFGPRIRKYVHVTRPARAADVGEINSQALGRVVTSVVTLTLNIA